MRSFCLPYTGIPYLNCKVTSTDDLVSGYADETSILIELCSTCDVQNIHQSYQ